MTDSPVEANLYVNATVVDDAIDLGFDEPHEMPVVGPEIWRLIEDALAEGGEPASLALGCNDIDSARKRWESAELSASFAAEIAQQLRKAAFDAKNLGEASVQIVGPDSEHAAQPGALVTLASVFDLLSALAGASGKIMFKPCEAH
jgi:hypothetical protein